MPVKRRLLKMPDLPRSAWVGIFAIAGSFAAIWVAWLIYTWPVRSELRSVEHYLEGLPDLEKVELEKPFFSRVMPEQIPLLALAIPKEKFDYEVRVEVKGIYDTKTRVATIKGSKQVLMPYSKAVINMTVNVPKSN